VIVLLGMDDELFPQRSSTPWFDRLAAAPRPGDPDERGEQLQTVFDALCMAQDRLVITYTGWNRAGTMRLPPSVAVSALQDVVHRVVARTGDDTPHDTWRRHVERDVPLQPFSRRAFEDATVPSFDALAAHTAQQLARGTRGAATGTGRRTATADQTAPAGALVRTRDTLPLRTLLTFLERPAEEILSRLGVRLGHELTLVDDVLPLTMPRRDEAGAVTGMAHALLTERDIAVQLERLRHRDIMPPAALGRVWKQHATSKARYLAIRAHSAVGELPRRAREVLQVSVGHTTLTGTVDTRHGNTLLFLRDGKHNVVRMMRAFVTLCAAALGDSAVSHAVVVDADEITTLACPPDPAAVLRELVALYHDADRAVPPYVPASSLAYAEEIHKAISAAGVQATPDPETLARALEKARVTWDADDPSRPSECDEPANRLLHAVSPVEHPAFGSTARAVFLPMLAQVVGP
jgi:exodeoxyribonuclease V gamma subunit